MGDAMGTLERVLFESPIVAPAAIGLLGLVVAFALNRAGKGKGAVLAFVVGLVLAVGVGAVARVVETDREAAERMTRAFVAAAAAGDVEALDEMISERVAVSADGTLLTRADKGVLLSGAERVPGLITGYSTAIRGVEVDEGRPAVASFTVRVFPRVGGMVVTAWEMTWQESGEGWVATRLEATREGTHGVGPGGYEHWLR